MHGNSEKNLLFGRVLSLIDVISRKVLINRGLRGFRFIYQQNGMEAPNKANQPLWTSFSTDYQNINQAEHPFGRDSMFCIAATESATFAYRAEDQ